jgi:aspartyl-tRNA(Asn)/glutamyl-tRNA(Gln) amidotransferase subunit A
MSRSTLDNTVPAVARLLAERQISAAELVDHYLDRISQVDGALHSYVEVLGDEARAAAKRADETRMAGRATSPLHGVPFAVKDVFDAKGVATTAGSASLKDNIAKRDSTAVARLREAGAILLGKLATHELTHGGVDFDTPWPPARNPWNLEYDPGGSSSGPGAAVAAGLCTFALGTDTGGSIRKPAGNCGIAGLKPTYGRVSRYGVMLNAPSLDHCGPIARTAAGCAPVLQAIAGRDPLDPESSLEPLANYGEAIGKDIRGVRVGSVAHFWRDDLPIAKDVMLGMESALATLAELGADVRDVKLKPIAEFNEIKLNIQRPELFHNYGEAIRSAPEQFGPRLRNRMNGYETIPAVEYLKARERQRELAADMLTSMSDFDVLVTAGPGPAAKIRDVAARSNLNIADLTLPFSLTGFPVIAICIGFTPEGLPFSMQIVGKPFDELSVLRVADAYERATPWHRRVPELAGRAP